MTKSLLAVDAISVTRLDKHVLKNISFTINAGHNLAIAGETGSGKSTLLKVIAGLEQPTHGGVLLNNVHIKGPAEQLVPGHPDIAYLSQHFELPKFLRVEQILEYANKLSDRSAKQIFSICQINHLMPRKTHELSGGEKQRIAIARLLIQQPQLLLLDEPFAHLDIPMKRVLKQVINDIGGKLNISFILVSHDPADTLPWANEIMVLKNGSVVQRGAPQEIYLSPKNEYAAGLFGNYTKLDTGWIKKMGIKTTNNPAFIRPEQLRISRKSKTSVAGTVVSRHYFGNHMLLEISCNTKKFLIQVAETKYTSGERVWVSYKG